MYSENNKPCPTSACSFKTDFWFCASVRALQIMCSVYYNRKKNTRKFGISFTFLKIIFCLIN
jgi:hypothetical protein